MGCGYRWENVCTQCILLPILYTRRRYMSVTVLSVANRVRTVAPMLAARGYRWEQVCFQCVLEAMMDTLRDDLSVTVPPTTSRGKTELWWLERMVTTGNMRTYTYLCAALYTLSCDILVTALCSTCCRQCYRGCVQCVLKF